MPEKIKRLIAIVGPTGIGKSCLALNLAVLFHGEIVSADSRQVYRFLNIGTAKPSPEDLQTVPHHLIDIVNPDDSFNLARYQELAYQAIADIYQRNNLPFLVGGSGQYVKAVLECWHVPRVSPDHKFRYNIEKRAKQGETEKLYQELCAIDPDAAAKIDAKNVRRITRALEVHAKSKLPFSQLRYKVAPDFDSFVIGLTAERTELYKIVDRRVDLMIENGLVEEVAKLLKMGYDITLPAMSGIGYRQVVQYLNGELTLEEARKRIKTETHRFIRHQYAWFRLNDEKITWFDIQRHVDKDVERAVADYLKEDQGVVGRN